MPPPLILWKLRELCPFAIARLSARGILPAYAGAVHAAGVAAGAADVADAVGVGDVAADAVGVADVVCAVDAVDAADVVDAVGVVDAVCAVGVADVVGVVLPNAGKIETDFFQLDHFSLELRGFEQLEWKSIDRPYVAYVAVVVVVGCDAAVGFAAFAVASFAAIYARGTMKTYSN